MSSKCNRTFCYLIKSSTVNVKNYSTAMLFPFTASINPLSRRNASLVSKIIYKNSYCTSKDLVLKKKGGGGIESCVVPSHTIWNFYQDCTYLASLQSGKGALEKKKPPLHSKVKRTTNKPFWALFFFKLNNYYNSLLLFFLLKR